MPNDPRLPEAAVATSGSPSLIETPAEGKLSGRPVTTEAPRSLATETLAVATWTIAADLLLFRWNGHSASAAFFAVALLSLLTVHFWRDRSVMDQRSHDSAKKRRPGARLASRIALLLIVLAIIRLAWLGSATTFIAASLLLAFLSLSLSGWLPTMPQTVGLLSFSWITGFDRLHDYHSLLHSPRAKNRLQSWLALALPAAALVAFGGIFVMANPDLASAFFAWLSNWIERIGDFFRDFSVWEIPFCVLALLAGAGLLRPLVQRTQDPLLRSLLGVPETPVSNADSEPFADQPLKLYSAFRNTLVVLIALFAMYLVFEFRTLLRRDFPDGFYYAGYAHEGAAWLTTALALATLTLSMIFSRAAFLDPCIHRLKTLAWVWSALNLVLAFAVYNRLLIYVGYNGMTPMRTIGFFGITTVLVGFVLVIFKILHQKSVAWLVQSQAIALAAAFVLYSLFPVDHVAHRYNVGRVAQGDLPPSVMIAVKTIDDEGTLTLFELIDHEDVVIRDGVRALLARRQLEIEGLSRQKPWHWHRFQGSRRILYGRLSAGQAKWSQFLRDPASQSQAIQAFREYAMQWY